MRSILSSFGALALLGTLSLGLSGPAQAQTSTVFTEQQKQAIGEVVKDYLLKNPEILTEVMAELEKRHRG